MFNSNNTIPNSPIYVIDAEEYQGKIRNNVNPIILGYNGSHYESLDTCSEEDNIKAMNLVESVKLGEYKLEQKDMQHITRITRIKRSINISKGNTSKAKVNKGEHTNTKNRGAITKNLCYTSTKNQTKNK